MKPNYSVPSRRAFLGSLASAGTLLAAGCADGEEPTTETATPPTDSYYTETKENDVTPAVYKRVQSDGEFKHENIAKFSSSQTSVSLSNRTIAIPDNRTTTIEIKGETARVEIAGIKKQKKDLEFALRVRDESGNFKTNTKVVTAPESPSENFQPIEITFDISNIQLPLNGEGYAILTVKNAENWEAPHRTLKTHQFLGVEYANGTKIKWINGEVFNPEIITEIRDEGTIKNTTTSYNPIRRENGVIREDTGDYISVFLTARNTINGETIGVSADISKDAIEYLRENNLELDYEITLSEKIHHLNEIAEKIYEKQTEMGLTSPYERIQTLANLIQFMQYKSRTNVYPTETLISTNGNCSSKSFLFASICSALDIDGCFIRCDYRKSAHRAVAVDVDEFDSLNTEDRQTFTDENSNEYVFIELTTVNKIGGYSKYYSNEEFESAFTNTGNISPDETVPPQLKIDPAKS